jgi:hypothetical protein
MSSAGTRTRDLPFVGPIATSKVLENGDVQFTDAVLAKGKQITVSESHKRDPNTGHYYDGGPFYTSRVSVGFADSHVSRAYRRSKNLFYSGPIRCKLPTVAEMNSIGYKNTTNQFGDKNESQMKVDGTTAIAHASPINPVSNLGVSLGELVKDRLPIPGIPLWKSRTKAAKAAGSEYLNAQFGWLPLVKEVQQVGDAARNHRWIMENYQHGEGRNTRRSFGFPSQTTGASKIVGTEYPIDSGIQEQFIAPAPASERSITLERMTDRWFEGVFTYGLPSSTDSWRKALGFGSEADHLFGLTLTPKVMWELTPWSWAVDWFSNAGEVITNVTNFGLAGLVLRYGYMMETTIERVTAEVGKTEFYSTDKPFGKDLRTYSSGCSSYIETVTKRRMPASPFGFGIGWEGLSPTQLAITAALGITRLL